MEIKYLNTFKTIIETGSFLSAARRLNYTQSTITFQVQQLERELSVKLFEKIGRKMVVTKAGKDILPIIDNILQSVEMLQNYGKETEELTGTLKIAMPETLLTYRMQPVLKAFREKAPKVKLSIQALNCYVIRDQVINGETDIGFHYDVGGYSESVVLQKLSEFSLSLISSPNLSKNSCNLKDKGQRNSVCLISNDRNSIFERIFNNYLEEKDITLDGTMELESIEAVKRSVASNLGVAFLPRYVVEEELKSGVLKEIETDTFEEKISAVCTYHKNKWMTPAMKLFISLAKDNL